MRRKKEDGMKENGVGKILIFKNCLILNIWTQMLSNQNARYLKIEHSISVELRRVVGMSTPDPFKRGAFE